MNSLPPLDRDSVRSVNLEYYLKPSPGRADYWRKMAAPRFRVATILKLLLEMGPGYVLDMGCGGGEMLLEVKGALPEASLCGVDIAPHQIEANCKTKPGIDWRVADLEQEQHFPSDLAGRFDAILAVEIVEHMTRPEVFLKNAKRLAKPGFGRLLLSTQSGPVLETERRVGHRRHFSAGDMKELLVESGWEPLAVWNTGFPFHDLSKWIANVDPDKTMRQFGDLPYTHFQNAVCVALRFLFKFNSDTRGAQLFAVARCP